MVQRDTQLTAEQAIELLAADPPAATGADTGKPSGRAAQAPSSVARDAAKSSEEPADTDGDANPEDADDLGFDPVDGQDGDDGADAGHGSDAPPADEDGGGQADDDPALTSQPVTDDARTVELYIDGQRRRLSLAEVKQGYLRQQDYSRKTQELAGERQQIADLKAVRQRYVEIVEELADGLPLPPMPDEQLRDTDFFTYARLKDEHETAVKKRDALRAERDRARKEAHEHALAERQALVKQSRQVLVERVPAFADPVKRKAGLAAIVQTAQSIGFTPEEVASWVDPHVFLALYELAQRRSAEARGRAKLANGNGNGNGKPPAAAPSTRGNGVSAPPRGAARPAAATASPAQRKIAAARERFNTRPTVDSAVDLLLANAR